jgi:hypothetical protein
MASLPAPRSPDLELVSYVGSHGVVTVDHVVAALGIHRATAFRHISSCIEGCLLERFTLQHSKLPLLRATRRGLRYAGLRDLPSAEVSLSSVDHRLRCASTAQLLLEEFPLATIFSERDIRARERISGQIIASASLPDNRLRLPDLAVLTDAGTIAVEVELSPKGPARLDPLIEAWKQADHVSEVRYYAKSGTTRRGLQRAIDKANASERIRIFDVPLARLSLIRKTPMRAPLPRFKTLELPPPKPRSSQLEASRPSQKRPSRSEHRTLTRRDP